LKKEISKFMIGTKYAALHPLKHLTKNIEDSKLISDTYWKIVSKATKWLRHIPYIRLICVCNNLALGNVNHDSDIDLFIVVQPKRIFIARFLSTILMHVLALRRHGTKIHGRVCLSFYITEDVLDLSSLMISPDDIYLAYWLLSLLPVYDQKTSYMLRLVRENAWLGDFFENYDRRMFETFKPLSNVSRFKKISEMILDTFIGNNIEKVLYNFFYSRYERNKKYFGENSSVIVSKNILKYHNNDRRADILRRFNNNIKCLGSV
jgi:hypothetical protein